MRSARPDSCTADDIATRIAVALGKGLVDARPGRTRARSRRRATSAASGSVSVSAGPTRTMPVSSSSRRPPSTCAARRRTNRMSRDQSSRSDEVRRGVDRNRTDVSCARDGRRLVIRPSRSGGAVGPVRCDVPVRSASLSPRAARPARIGRSRRFSGGASGHAQRGSNAQDGWNAKLKSTMSVPVAGSPPRSALLAASTR